MIGIYALYWPAPDKVYIGQSDNIDRRTSDHLYLLRSGSHYNKKLQEVYTKYGPPEILILEECARKDLDSKEIYYIEEFDSVNLGLNISAGGIGGQYGYYSSKCLASRDQIIQAFKLLLDPHNSYEEICSITGVSEGTLESIRYLKRHRWLLEEFPKECKILQESSSKRLSIAQVNRFATVTLLLSPTGDVHEVFNISQFASEHNLNKGHLAAVARGVEKSHKGWTLIERRVGK